MYKEKKVAALIAAGGSGSRFGADSPKQFCRTGAEPMLAATVRVFENSPLVDDIFIIYAPGYEEETRRLTAGFTKVRGFVSGGATRPQSVRNGLEALTKKTKKGTVHFWSADIVLIHDAARPFVSDSIIEDVLRGAEATGAAVPCVPVTDTLYKVDERTGGSAGTAGEFPEVYRIPERKWFYAAQTPQGFDFDMILAAHRKAAADGYEATDDGSVALRYGAARVVITQGDPANRKITFAADLENAERGDDTKKNVPFVSGTGFDVHALAEGRELILGGVPIPFEKGLLGHSDADVLTHALMDALLGALALGDIGTVFPDTDERYRGISSMTLLAEVMRLVRERGYAVANADMTIIAERPKMGPYRDEIIASLAAALGVDAARVSVKATTTEGLGFAGREEGIGAQAVALLKLVE
ncbi:MAG: 2-C-methyl-D-erythritol 2,4-cyclodiphosphate synthase [Clostridiales Family XIII bacterium]|jgi:2-C-methyl-D-erythritol 4-phosphate cytidylyltransferase/2-C-methyl-D-erythritol 2,4-cyclodiphosphate synthase|nr:2-C-methyl-D-erythritol 2,4-cyclodiphosphate synthase [Clostridiales Family XIII bacterium]